MVDDFEPLSLHVSELLLLILPGRLSPPFPAAKSFLSKSRLTAAETQ